MLESTLITARVRISQAVRLLEQVSERPQVDDEGQGPQDLLATADSLWRQLVKLQDDGLELWDRIEVDGLHAQDVVARLKDIVYELLLVVLPAS
jgi:hypothetical protein